MKTNIMFPCDFFNKTQVDDDYKEEYKQAIKFNFNVIIYDYDTYIQEDKINIHSSDLDEGVCIYRGYMLKPEQYNKLYEFLIKKGIKLINSLTEYENCHLFPKSYNKLKDFTPQTLVFENFNKIDWDFVKQSFDKFMIKDFVKSVKGHNFPKYFDNSYSNGELNGYIEKFKDIRGNLFTGGIVIKEFVELKSLGTTTNEYRAFYLYNNLITLSKNSNQTDTTESVPEMIINSIPKLNSNFYTVDFAELKNGNWIVVETGDGQVSGLATNQNVFEYYKQISLYFTK